jgi:V/A-type H+-transporting ATPase subunit D
MHKIKLTKGELKKHRDALRQYSRYLPTLQLKKQQLQIEILHRVSVLNDKKKLVLEKYRIAELWAGLLSDQSLDLRDFVKVERVSADPGNIAGVDFRVFKSAEFSEAEYDLFSTPLWADRAVIELREIASLNSEIAVLEETVSVLRRELRIATQRVNLFEKVKIPESEEAIRAIKIFIGDQMTNAVGRSKIAKKKIEEAAGERLY